MISQLPRSLCMQVSHIKQNTKIPVLGHADGICHIYVDEVRVPSRRSIALYPNLSSRPSG